MVCDTCGRNTQNEEANFCEYCGSSFREQPIKYNENTTQQPEAILAEGKEEPISFINWLGTYGMIFIPIVGWIISLVMLFVWAFQKNGSKTKKNWARATMIFLVVYFTLAMLLFSYMMSGVINNPAFQDILQGSYI